MKKLLLVLSLLSVAWVYEDADSISTVSLGQVTITVYQMVESQTDGNPHITADGTDLRETNEVVCALSQDLMFFRGGPAQWGDALWLCIPNYPEGPVVECIVRDTMAETIYRVGKEVPLVCHVDLLDGAYGKWAGHALLIRRGQ